MTLKCFEQWLLLASLAQASVNDKCEKLFNIKYNMLFVTLEEFF